MKYSIIVPVHNVERYLAKAVNSVLKQSYKDLELILIDDGSSDSSGDICDRMAAADRRVVVVHQICQGVSAARNVGIDMARGEYIIFLDSDDYWNAINALELIDKAMDGVDVVCFGYKRVTDETDENNYPLTDHLNCTMEQYETGRDFLIKCIQANPVFPWYCWRYIFKKILWNETEALRFPAGIRMHEDMAVVYKALLRAKSVKEINVCVYAYRSHSSSVCKEDNIELLLNRVTVNQEQIDYIERSSSIEEPLKSLLCKNMAAAFYTDLIHVCALPTEEQTEIINYLKNVQKKFTKYPATKKQKTVNIMLMLIGMRNTCRILNYRRRMKSTITYKR